MSSPLTPPSHKAINDSAKAPTNGPSIESTNTSAKISFASDNHSGIHPKILDVLVQQNRDHAPSYGLDDMSLQLNQRVREHFGDEALCSLVFNGTAANVLCYTVFLKSYESVICSEQSHAHLDECGAPEKIAGIKLHTLPSQNGKISVEQIREALKRRGDQHHSQPRMVSLTQPTEWGVCYSLSELRTISDLCRAEGLYLHLDGARLANSAHYLDCDLKELCFGSGVDVVSFGGTKNGLMGAELVVYRDETRAQDVKFYRKQLMQLPSKTRFLSAQFLAYLSGGLMQQIAAHSHSMAKYLELRLQEIPEVKVLETVESNAVFARFPKAWTKSLREKVFFYIWDSDLWIARWMMSFDSTKEHVDLFIDEMKRLQTEKPV